MHKKNLLIFATVMKKYTKIQLIVIFTLFIMVMVFNSCKKKEAATAIITAPTATSSAASYIGPKWAVLNGVVNANNEKSIASFEYDTTTAYGHSINAASDTVIGNTSILVSVGLSGLKVNTTYHYRLKAENSLGTAYGDDISFTTAAEKDNVILFNPDLTYGSVSDNDGNIYKTIQMGSQTWMAENLRTTKFNDNTPIPFVTEVAIWSELTTSGFTWYNNDSIGYGALYNWYSVNTGKLCPTGWHVPSDEEWTGLTTYFGGDTIAGDKIKETGTLHWLSPNTGATNESGLTALPGGYRNYIGSFRNIKKIGYWWSSTSFNTIDAYYRFISSDDDMVVKSNSNQKGGFSVRCLKDN
jgi:uncharacterized protein (TIGR02145 family)